MTYIITHSGIKFDIIDIDSEHIVIEDIARSLSRQCRWTGHTLRFYSVAQHSVHVGEHLLTQQSKGLQLAGLLHDASEAYIGDVSRPLKSILTQYRVLEERIQQAVYRKFCQCREAHPAIHMADDRLLEIEQSQLMHHGGPARNTDPILPYWDHNTAYAKFMQAFKDWS